MPYLGNPPAEAYSTTVKDSFNGDASTTAFTLSQPSTTNNLRVVVENVIQDPTVAYTVSGTTLTFTSAPPVGTANIYAVHLGPATMTAVPPDEINEATTYTSDLTVQGDLTASANVVVTGNLTVDTNTLYVDSTNNRVGVGTTSPDEAINIGFSGADDVNAIRIEGSNGSSQRYAFDIVADGENSRTDFKIGTVGNTPTTKMTLDGSGNLLVGTTDGSPYNNSAGSDADNGVVIDDGRIWAARYAGTPLDINRTGSDGDILTLRIDGTEIGVIGSVSGANVFFATKGGSNQCGISPTGGSDPRVIPCNATGSAVDNGVDLGYSNARWDDLWATNSSIQTSDANEKQQIASLTDAEITAAKAISKLFKTYKWNSAVETKGDAARTHTGVIAQEVQQAMTDAGLDAGNYAFFISSTWWETQTEVPAVEAVDEVVDEDGNVVTEAVEAQEAYTRTDTYDTAEEAPANATERNRKGIRYPELLSFIGAATEQRLTSIEARLATLENV